MKRIITGATGLIGKAVTREWIRQGHQVMAVGRSKAKIASLFGSIVHAFTWDEFCHIASKDLNDVDVVLNLAGASIAEQRWTSKRKDEILNSRIDATQTAVDFCVKNNLPLFNASAVGIYGTQKSSNGQLPEALDEQSSQDVDESDFLAYVCRRWEGAVQPCQEKGIRTVILRLGVVLDRKEGAFPKMILPFKMFAGGPLGSGKQPVPWISIDDVVKAIDYIVGKAEINGPVNVVSPGCVQQKDFAIAIGKAMHRPSFIPTPGFVLKLALGDMADPLLLRGQNVNPKVLNTHQFSFKHPTIEHFLKSLK